MFRRFYHVSTVVYNFKKQGYTLSKMLNPKSKKTWHQPYDALPTIKSLAKTTREPSKRAIRRVAVLNKLFMKNITDIMSTGTFSIQILGRGIEISKVKITPDYHLLNVYWVCKGTISDVETEELLNRTAGPLRRELSCLRLMGEVPYITFMKDKQEAMVYDLDRRLALADYGEDYVPTEIGHILKSEFSIQTKLSPEMKAKIKQLEEESPMEDVPLPVMLHTVLGLDHASIMNRLYAARKKSLDAWRSVDLDSTVTSYRASDTDTATPPLPDTASHKQDLADFLKKRQILQNKMHKDLRDTRAEREAVFQDKHNDDDHCYVNDDYYDDEDDYYSDDDYIDDALERDVTKVENRR